MTARRSYSDAEIARHVLGLDLGEQGRAIEALLAHDDTAAARALKWETYLLGIVDGLQPLQPPDTVLARVRQTLGMTADAGPPAVSEQAPQASVDTRRRWFHRLGLPLTVAATTRLVLAVVVVVILGAAALALWAYTHPPSPTVVHETVKLPPAPPGR